MKEKVVVKTPRLLIYPIDVRHLRFLLRLWNDPVIMRYAGFSKNWDYSDIKNWYEKYKNNQKKYGSTDVHFVLKRKNGPLFGESGLGRLRKSWSCPGYKSSKDKLTLMADVKLEKNFWNQGYGTEAMKAIVQYVFTQTDADLLLVPPHKENIPAIRVYQKAGFKKTKGIWYRYHIIYKITKELYGSIL